MNGESNIPVQALIEITIGQLPAAIALFRNMFKKKYPDAAQPTSAEVLAAFNYACVSTLAKDAAILARLDREGQ